MTILSITIYRGLTFGPLVITAKNEAGAIQDLTGWTAYAEIRKTPGTVLLNLSPSIPTPTTGEISIEVSKETTAGMTEGQASWDLVLQTPTSKRRGPFIGGGVNIVTAITQPA